MATAAPRGHGGSSFVSPIVDHRVDRQSIIQSSINKTKNERMQQSIDSNRLENVDPELEGSGQENSSPDYPDTYHFSRDTLDSLEIFAAVQERLARTSTSISSRNPRRNYNSENRSSALLEYHGWPLARWTDLQITKPRNYEVVSSAAPKRRTSNDTCILGAASPVKKLIKTRTEIQGSSEGSREPYFRVGRLSEMDEDTRKKHPLQRGLPERYEMTPPTRSSLQDYSENSTTETAQTKFYSEQTDRIHQLPLLTAVARNPSWKLNSALSRLWTRSNPAVRGLSAGMLSKLKRSGLTISLCETVGQRITKDLQSKVLNSAIKSQLLITGNFVLGGNSLSLTTSVDCADILATLLSSYNLVYIFRDPTTRGTGNCYHREDANNLPLYLSESGVAITGIDACLLLLCFAVLRGRTDIVRWLAQAGADVNRKDKRTGLTPLHYAIMTRSPEMVRTLVGCGAVARVEEHTTLNLPRFWWVNRIVSTLAYATGSGSHPEAACGETSDASNERKRKHTTGVHPTRFHVAKIQASSQRSNSDNRNNPSDDDDQPKKRRRGPVERDAVASPDRKFNFACPYAKYDPTRFGDVKCCGLTAYSCIPRVKDHLNRKHRIYNCERCGLTSFEDKDEMNDHIAAGQCKKSERLPRNYSNGYNTRQADKIEGRWRGQDPTEKWKRIYRILFELSGNDPVPSPYFQTRAQLQYENQRLWQLLQEALISQCSPEELSNRMEAFMSEVRENFNEDQDRVRDMNTSVPINENHAVHAVVQAPDKYSAPPPSVLEEGSNVWPYQELGFGDELSLTDLEIEFPRAIDLKDESGFWLSGRVEDLLNLANDGTLAQQSSVSSIDQLWSNDSMISTELETSVEDMCNGGLQEAVPVDDMQESAAGMPPANTL